MSRPLSMEEELDTVRSKIMTDLRDRLDEFIESHRTDLQRLLNEIREETIMSKRDNAEETQCCCVRPLPASDLRSPGVASLHAEYLESRDWQPSLGDGSMTAGPCVPSDLTLADDPIHASSGEEKPAHMVKMSSLPSGARLKSSPSRQFISNRAGKKANNQERWIDRVVNSAFFENVSGLLILVNAIVIGAHADERGRHPEACDEEWADAFLIFNCIFLIELLLRLAAYGKEFWCGVDVRWNLFDVIIVVTGFLEDIITRSMGSIACGLGGAAASSPAAERTFTSSITALRILRVMRVVRMVKAFRTMAIFRDLRIMVQSTLNCLMPLVWACVLLAFVLWCFSIYFVHLAADHLSFAHATIGPSAFDSIEAKEVEKWFGSLPASMFTLFLSITGGTNWENPSGALSQLSGEPFSTIIYISFISLTAFAMLNVITGVFVENATNCAKKDRDVAIRAALKNKDQFVKDVVEVFHEADLDGSGALTIHEFQETFEDPRVQAFFECLQLDGITPQQLFRILDDNSSGTVSLDDFISGCSGLKGDAKKADIAMLRMDMDKVMGSILAALAPQAPPAAAAPTLM